MIGGIEPTPTRVTSERTATVRPPKRRPRRGRRGVMRVPRRRRHESSTPKRGADEPSAAWNEHHAKRVLNLFGFQSTRGRTSPLARPRCGSRRLLASAPDGRGLGWSTKESNLLGVCPDDFTGRPPDHRRALQTTGFVLATLAELLDLRTHESTNREVFGPPDHDAPPARLGPFPRPSLPPRPRSRVPRALWRLARRAAKTRKKPPAFAGGFETKKVVVVYPIGDPTRQPCGLSKAGRMPKGANVSIAGALAP